VSLIVESRKLSEIVLQGSEVFGAGSLAKRTVLVSVTMAGHLWRIMRAILIVGAGQFFSGAIGADRSP